MTDKVIVVGYQDEQEVYTVVSVPEPIDFLAFSRMVRCMNEFKETKIVDILDAHDHHFCGYCGAVASGSDENVLCDDCAELFGHRLYSEL